MKADDISLKNDDIVLQSLLEELSQAFEDVTWETSHGQDVANGALPSIGSISPRQPKTRVSSCAPTSLPSTGFVTRSSDMRWSPT